MKAPFLRNSAVVLAVAAALSAMAGLQDEVPPELKSDEQLHLLRTINLALRNYTATTQAKAVEAVYRVNLDMVKEMSALDRRTVLAEVFATVPEFALPAVADGFATDLFWREAAESNPNDDSFADFAISAMLRIYRRCRDLDLAGQRRTVFAVIMFLKASEGKIPDLQSQLETFIPDSLRDMARDVWIPSALGDSYRESMCERLIVPEVNADRISVHDSGMTILPWAQSVGQGVFCGVLDESATEKKKGAQ